MTHIRPVDDVSVVAVVVSSSATSPRTVVDISVPRQNFGSGSGNFPGICSDSRCGNEVGRGNVAGRGDVTGDETSDKTSDG